MSSSHHPYATAVQPAVFRRVVVCDPLDTVCTSTDRDLMRNGIDIVARDSIEDMLVALHEDAPDAIIVRASAAGENLSTVIDVVHRWASIPVILGIRAGDAGHGEAERALDAGANALVTLPFSADELRRSLAGLGFPSVASSSAAQVGALHIDPVSHRALVHDREVALTHREFSILHFLAVRAPRLVPPGDIARHVSPAADPEAAARGVRVAIGSIRAKLARASAEGESLIETIRGVGYRVRESGSGSH